MKMSETVQIAVGVILAITVVSVIVRLPNAQPSKHPRIVDTPYSAVYCVDDVEYLTFSNGVTPHLHQDGQPYTCNS